MGHYRPLRKSTNRTRRKGANKQLNPRLALTKKIGSVITLRILFFNRWVGCHIGGTETHIKELAYRLAKRGHSIDILTTEGEELRELEGLIRIRYVSKNSREISLVRPLSEDPWLLFYAIMFGVKSILKLLSMSLKGKRYDVISVHCTLEAFLMRCFKWLFRTPYIFVFEGYTHLEARMAKHADLQIAISQSIINECSKNYRFKPILIPVGIDAERFTPFGKKLSIKWPGDKKPTMVLTVSRLSPPKDISTLVRAAEIVCTRDPSFAFFIVGDGSERRKIERLVNEFDLQDRIFLTGRVSDEMLPIYYRSADIFVSTHPSVDQFWIVTLEAMSSGLPVVWTFTGTDLKDVENWGIAVPPRNPEKLADAIMKVAYNEELRKEISEKGLIKIKKFDWNNLIIEYENAYLSVIRGLRE